MASWGRPPASVVLFIAIVAGVAAWIGSGMLQRDPPTAPTAEERPPVTVAARWSEAEPIERRLTLYGDIVPNQIVLVRAEVAGRVAEMATARGELVEPNEALARLAPGDRPARLRRAQAQLSQARREYQTATQLVERDAAPAIRLDTAEAELEAAEAEVEAIEVEVENLTLRAPIAGVVNRLIAEVGDFVPVGGEAVEIVDNDPLIAVVQVPQHSVARVRAGGEANITITGRGTVAGDVRSVAPLADAETRTFRVEIEIPNADRQLPSGVSAEVIIPTETVLAHSISPAIVSLNDRGETGVFAVDDANTVVFHPIQLVRAEENGIWITGPPDRARLITARPGFVTEGQQVNARDPDEVADGLTAPGS